MKKKKLSYLAKKALRIKINPDLKECDTSFMDKKIEEAKVILSHGGIPDSRS